MNENLNKDRIKKKKKKYNEYAIDKNKLEYLGFICEEEDIDLFCNFNEQYEPNNKQTDYDKNLYNFTDNLKFNDFKYIDFENSYLTILVQNENIEDDKKSCLSISFIYEHFLYYCDFFYSDYKKNHSMNFIKNYEKDINFFNLLNKKRNRISKKRKKKTHIEGNTKKNEQDKINRNYDVKLNYKQKHDTKLNESHNNISDSSNIITYTYIAYNKLQNELFEYYIPKLNYNKIICFDKYLKSEINNTYNCTTSETYINKNYNDENTYIGGTLHTKNIKKNEKYNCIISVKKQYTKLKEKEINLKKKKKYNSSLDISNLSSFYLHNYTSSEESVISFSKFLHTSKSSRKKKSKLNRFIPKKEEENNSKIIFKEIIDLCKQNKIFTFRKNIKENKNSIIKNCNKKTFNKKLHNFNKVYHIDKNIISEKIFKRVSTYSTDKNLSSFSRISTNCDNSKQIHLTHSRNSNKDVLERFHKKRSFSLCSVDKEEEKEKSKKSNKTIKGYFHEKNLEKIGDQEIPKVEKEKKDAQKKVIKEKEIILDKKNNYNFLNFMNIKKKKENNLLKIEILKGLNQTHYDPLYLEKIVNNKNNLNEEKMEKQKNHCNKKHLHMNKKTNVINEIFQLFILENFHILKFKFSSLYINEKYNLITKLYKYEYIHFDFYLTIIFIKSLIKLKKYSNCLKYIFEISKQNLSIFNKSILYYFCGICYEKLDKLKLSTKEYSKAIVHQLNNNKSNKLPNKLEKKDKNNEIEILPFILFCLDKLIGSYHLKAQEEDILLKYVQLHYDLNKHIYFYLSKVNRKKEYNINEFMNSKNEITLNKISDPNNYVNSTKMEEGISFYLIPGNFNKKNDQEKDKMNCIIFNSKNKNEKKNSRIYEKNTYNDEQYIENAKKNASFINYDKNTFYIEKIHKGERSYLFCNTKKNSVILREKDSRRILKKKKDYSYKKYINMNNLCLVSSENDMIDHKEYLCNDYFVDDEIYNNKDKNLKKKIIHYFDKIIINKNINYKLFNYNDFFIYILDAFFNFHCKKTLSKISKFVDANFSNKNLLNSIKKLGFELKLIDIHFTDNSEKIKTNEMRDNKIIEEKMNAITKYEKCIHPNEIRKKKGTKICCIDKLITTDIICINLYCFKNYDFINSYYISKYLIKIKEEYENEDAIILYVSSLININEIFKNKKNKIKELLLLYSERVSAIRDNNKIYYFNPDCYIYKKDFLDYFIFGIIHFLKKDLRKSYLYLTKCINLKKKFYLSYIFLLQICLINNIPDKKLIFYQCLKLKPYNILPYLIYASSLIKSLKNNLKKVPLNSTIYVKDILTKAIDLDKENLFIYNELFVYYFILKDFLQCEIIIKKIFTINKFFSSSISPICSILFNVAIYNIYQRNLKKAEKYLIKILYTNPFHIKSLQLLTHILYMKKNKIWIYFFDYSLYLENVLYSKKVISYKTYLCESFFKKLKQLQDFSIFICYYKKLKKIKRYYSFIKNYIEKNYFSFTENSNRISNVHS